MRGQPEHQAPTSCSASIGRHVCANKFALHCNLQLAVPRQCMIQQTRQMNGVSVYCRPWAFRAVKVAGASSHCLSLAAPAQAQCPSRGKGTTHHAGVSVCHKRAYDADARGCGQPDLGLHGCEAGMDLVDKVCAALMCARAHRTLAAPLDAPAA